MHDDDSDTASTDSSATNAVFVAVATADDKVDAATADDKVDAGGDDDIVDADAGNILFFSTAEDIFFAATFDLDVIDFADADNDLCKHPLFCNININALLFAFRMISVLQKITLSFKKHSK